MDKVEIKYNEINEISEEEYLKEIEIIYKMFPNAKFSVCIDLNMMNDVLTEKDIIVIKSDYSCYCYRDCPRNTDFFIIHRPQNGKITYRHILTELMNQGLDLDCNHSFIEDIYPSKNTDCQYQLWLGS